MKTEDAYALLLVLTAVGLIAGVILLLLLVYLQQGREGVPFTLEGAPFSIDAGVTMRGFELKITEEMLLTDSLVKEKHLISEYMCLKEDYMALQGGLWDRYRKGGTTTVERVCGTCGDAFDATDFLFVTCEDANYDLFYHPQCLPIPGGYLLLTTYFEIVNT